MKNGPFHHPFESLGPIPVKSQVERWWNTNEIIGMYWDSFPSTMKNNPVPEILDTARDLRIFGTM